MKKEFKKSTSAIKTPLILSFLSVISGAICFVLGEITLPLPIAFLAALYYFDNTKNRLPSIISSALIVAMNTLGVVLGLTFSTFGASSVALAYIMYFAFKRKQVKSDAAFVMTIICAAFSVVSCAILAMMFENNYSIEGVADFYTKLVEMLRGNFVTLMLDVYTAAGLEVTAEAINQLFNMQLNMIISYLIIGAFFIVGLGFKIFGFIIKKCTDGEEISSWRFFTSNLYAYFYVILTFVTLFMTSLDSVIAVAAFNLYYIFMAVYAYVGFNVALAILSTRMNKFVSFVLISGALLVFSSLGIQLLAVLGVIFTIRKNKEAIYSNS